MRWREHRKISIVFLLLVYPRTYNFGLRPDQGVVFPIAKLISLVEEGSRAGNLENGYSDSNFGEPKRNLTDRGLVFQVSSISSFYLAC